MSIYDQSRTVSRPELKGEIEDIISRMVPGDSVRGPSDTTLLKAGRAIEEIMAIVDRYSRR